MFDETVIGNLFPDRSAGARALLVHRACQAGEILRLKRGLFVLAPSYRKSEPHPFVVAAMLHAPSHISLESALAHHGLIPEAVYQVSSVTVARSREFRTPLGVFSFRRVPARAPRGEFLHVDDLAEAAVFLMQNYDGEDLVNVGTGEDLSIAELAELVREVVGYKGCLVYDTSKPDGTPRKLLDVSRLAALGWRARIPLREGLVQTYRWYAANAAK